jgi:hypothetical protein
MKVELKGNFAKLSTSIVKITIGEAEGVGIEESVIPVFMYSFSKKNFWIILVQ